MLQAEPKLPAPVRVGTLDELRDRGVMVVHNGRFPVAVFAHGEGLFAVDNRCPHLGFPLHKGTVKDGILTCHWHEARFDLASGCTFDLFADDVPTYETSVQDGVVFISPVPVVPRDAEFYRRRLKLGLEHDISLMQAKSIIGLRRNGWSFADIVREVALFGSRNHDAWREGMEILTIVSRLSPFMGDETAYYALLRASRQVASDCSGAAASRVREALGSDAHPVETLKRWFRQWVRARHRDGAERVLLTAIENGTSEAELTDLVCTALTDRIFGDVGHAFDFANKAFELLEFMGWQHAARIFPLVIRTMVTARGAEEDAHWHHPVELIEPLRQADERIEQLMERGSTRTWQDDGSLVGILLGDNPLEIIAALERALAAGAAPRELSKWVAYAAAMRLARFAIANEVGDWFNPQHTLIFANAVHQAICRSPSPGVVRGIFHAALAVYMDRFLNVPPARLPAADESLDSLPSDSAGLREQLLAVLDRRSEVATAAKIVARYMRLGHPIEQLVDTLIFATVREDLDFHTLQVLESGVQQLGEWRDRAEAEHIMIGIARQLAAFCPTPRTGLQTAIVALRLERGEKIYEDD